MLCIFLTYNQYRNSSDIKYNFSQARDVAYDHDLESHGDTRTHVIHEGVLSALP